MYFLIPYISYIIRNCPEFRITEFVEFRDFWYHGIPHNFILFVSSIVKSVSWHFFSSSFDFFSWKVKRPMYIVGCSPPNVNFYMIVPLKAQSVLQSFFYLTPCCQIDSPLHHAEVRFDSPLHHAAVRFDSPLHHAAVRFDSPLPNAAVGSDSPLQDAAGSHNAVGRFYSQLHNAKCSGEICLPAA